MWGIRAFAVCLTLVGACSKEQPSQQGDSAAQIDATPVAATTTASAEHARAATSTVDANRIVNADKEPGNWMTTGRTYSEQRFSPLDRINAQNVAELGLAWYWDTGTKRGLEATPIVVDGVMFTTGSWSAVYAHEAKTGELLWQYDPQVPREWGKYACCDVVNRGVAVWKGKVFVGTIDGRLIALDAGTGKEVWSVQTTDKERPYTITGAPRVVKDMVIIGNGGAELGVRGYITAYDTETGAQKWRFYTVPGDPSQPFEGGHLEKAAATWLGGKWWEVGGGGTVWDSMAYDAELNLLYIGTGNGSPWNRYLRSPGGGDNLYLASIVAVNPDDGSMKWFYQTTPGDTWDYTATQHMIVADLDIGGTPRKVIMQAPKNGFFYVLDRTNGEFISAEAYVPVTWATGIDKETGKPIENPDAHYANEMKQIRPSPYGGHNWHPMSYSPRTNLVYIPVLDLSFKFAQDSAFKYQPGSWNIGVSTDQMVPSKTVEGQIADLKDIKGYLSAWDPVNQKEVWRVQHPMSWNGGLVSTAGNLVFQGRSDGYFAAYSADEGKLLWEFPVHTGIIAAPVSFMVDGEQYIAVAAGWGGAFGLASGVPRHRNNVLSEGRILVFKLGGKTTLPEPKVTYIAFPTPPDIPATPEEVAKGESLFHAYCATCHGPGAGSAGPIPDLRFMSADTHTNFNAIVLGGAYVGKGMASFSSVLDEAGARAVHAYIVSQAKAGIEFCKTEYPKEYPELFGTACERIVEPSASAVAAGQ
jgi:PQQ-dependent dehydrogenase (methanol/ethanol family)